MNKTILIISFLFASVLTYAQFFEPWSEPVLITDTLSYNSNPDLLVLETASYLFYEKKTSIDGPSKIYYREIKNMGEEIELFGDPTFSYRNPVLNIEYDNQPEPYLFFESDMGGNYDIYVLSMDEFMNIGDVYQLTFTPEDENNADYTGWYQQLIWDINGEIRSAQVQFFADTVYIQNTMTIDSEACFSPKCCNSRIVYLKTEADSSAVYFVDWNYAFSQWGDPQILDNTGDNSYCHCSEEAWGYTYEDVVLYEKEGNIFNHYYDEIYELILPDFNDNMFAPHSVIYYLPVDYLPSPVIITFQSTAFNGDDIYVYSSEFSDLPENLSNDAHANSNPLLFWGWYAPNPCAMYLLDIWETQQNGFKALYLSKTSLYVCGGLEDQNALENNLKIQPNPFSNELKLKYKSNSSHPVDIEILNAVGQTLQHQQVHVLAESWNEFSIIPQGNVPKGILFIKLSQGSNQLFRKVIYY